MNKKCYFRIYRFISFCQLLLNKLPVVTALTIVQLTASQVTMADSNNNAGEDAEIIFPEIWIRELPMPNLGGRTISIFRSKENNTYDYMIRYGKQTKLKDGIRRVQTAAFSFFTGKELSGADSKSFYNKYQIVKGRSAVEFRSGEIWERDTLDKRIIKRCPQSLSNYIAVKNEKGKVINKFSILILPNNPSEIKIDNRCPYSPGESYKEKVLALEPAFVQLPDDTTLVYADQSQYILRLDHRYKSRSVYKEHNIYFVETRIIEELMENLELTDYKSIQEKLFVLLQKSAVGE